MEKSTQNANTVLGKLKPSKAVVKLAVPATLALLAKAIYNIVDTAYIGLLHSDNALAAVGVTLPILLIMVRWKTSFLPARRWLQDVFWELAKKKKPIRLLRGFLHCLSPLA